MNKVVVNKLLFLSMIWGFFIAPLSFSAMGLPPNLFYVSLAFVPFIVMSLIYGHNSIINFIKWLLFEWR